MATETLQEQPTTTAPAEATGAGLSDPSQIPAVRAVIDGSVPGIAFPKGLKTPAVQLMVKNLDSLRKAGLGFYKPDQKGIDAVMFNENRFSTEMLEKLDKAGLIKDFFPPFLPESDPFLQAARGEEPAPQAAAGGGATAPAMPSAKPAPAKAQAKMAQARKQNLTAEQPADQAKPGAGSIVNALSKRAV
jgi:hypothetical protein